MKVLGQSNYDGVKDIVKHARFITIIKVCSVLVVGWQSENHQLVGKREKD